MDSQFLSKRSLKVVKQHYRYTGSVVNQGAYSQCDGMAELLFAGQIAPIKSAFEAVSHLDSSSIQLPFRVECGKLKRRLK